MLRGLKHLSYEGTSQRAGAPLPHPTLGEQESSWQVISCWPESSSPTRQNYPSQKKEVVIMQVNLEYNFSTTYSTEKKTYSESEVCYNN